MKSVMTYINNDWKKCSPERRKARKNGSTNGRGINPFCFLKNLVGSIFRIRKRAI
jgi:hypothetical protein